MSERVAYNPQQYPGAVPQPTVDNAYPTSGADVTPAPGSTPLDDSAARWDGLRRFNKYIHTVSHEGADDQATQEAQSIASKAGLPYFSHQQLKQTEEAIHSVPNGSQQLQQLKQSLVDAATGPDPTSQETTSKIMSQAGVLATLAHINIWALLIIALKGAVRDKNDDLQDDLTMLNMFSKMSEAMAPYADIIAKTQQALETKINDTKDEKQKQNVEVPMPDQRNYEPWNMYTLDANGNMSYNETADPTNGGDNHNNMVGAQGLNIKTQMFTQERDQLEKKKEQWTNRFQNDNEGKNQLTGGLTSVLKNCGEMQSNISRNLDM